MKIIEIQIKSVSHDRSQIQPLPDDRTVIEFAHIVVLVNVQHLVEL